MAITLTQYTLLLCYSPPVKIFCSNEATEIIFELQILPLVYNDYTSKQLKYNQITSFFYSLSCLNNQLKTAVSSFPIQNTCISHYFICTTLKYKHWHT